MDRDELRDLLEHLHDKYNRVDFIEPDPISIPHLFTDRHDREVAGFMAATIAWGNRKAIVKSARRMMQYMDYAPLNVYGQTKLDGELAVSGTLEKYFIVRIAWVFGRNGNNFVKTMLNVGRKYDTLRVVNDQIGTPTYTFDLARLLVDMIQTEQYGYYHATNEGGYISWYDFTCEIFRQAGYTNKVVPVTTAEYGLNKANRPFNSRLDKSKLREKGFEPLPHWQDALSRYLKELEG